jgi:hypothetical protein
MGSCRKVLREKLAADQKSLDLLHPILMFHESDFMKSLSQEIPARLDLDGAVKHFLQRLEAYAPVILEVAHTFAQQLETLAEKALPSLVALAQLIGYHKAASGRATEEV